MHEVTAAQLADALDVSRARVSQWVSEGKLDGCYRGEGRLRRFDLARCVEALGRTLDASQTLGNGADTAAALETMRSEGGLGDDDLGDEFTDGLFDAQADTGALDDLARLRRAKADQAETVATKSRLALSVERGRYVLAADVQAQVARAVAAEMVEVDAVLRQAGEALAAEHGLDGRTVKAALQQHWRAHRQRRAGVARLRADQAEPTEAEAVEMQGV